MKPAKLWSNPWRTRLRIWKKCDAEHAHRPRALAYGRSPSGELGMQGERTTEHQEAQSKT